MNGNAKKNDEQAKKSGEDGFDGSDSDDLIEDLEPLSIQRSFSLPTSGPKGGKQQQQQIARLQKVKVLERKKQNIDKDEVGKLSEDEQLIAIFKLSVWICRRPEKELVKPEKAVLLLHAIQTLNGLQRSITSVQTLSSII